MAATVATIMEAGAVTAATVLPVPVIAEGAVEVLEQMEELVLTQVAVEAVGTAGEPAEMAPGEMAG